MNPTQLTLAQEVALLKEAVLLLVKRHSGEAYMEWPAEDNKRLVAIFKELSDG